MAHRGAGMVPPVCRKSPKWASLTVTTMRAGA